MPRQRIGLPKWLYQQLESGEYNGVSWVDRPDFTFKISWKHASSNKWSLKQDAALFRDWAIHKGKYIEGERDDPKKWKATFRCALNASRSILHIEDKVLESEGYKVFKFIKKTSCVLDSPNRKEKAKEDNRSYNFSFNANKLDSVDANTHSCNKDTIPLDDQKKTITQSTMHIKCEDWGSCMKRQGKIYKEKGDISSKDGIEEMSTNPSLSEILAALAKENEFQPNLYSSIKPITTTHINEPPQNNSRTSYDQYYSSISSNYERYPDLAQRLSHFNEYPFISQEHYYSSCYSPFDCSRSSSSISSYSYDD